MCSYTAGACPSGYSCKSWEFGAGSSQNDCYNKLKNSANMVAQ
jgi:hypothetical protein